MQIITNALSGLQGASMRLNASASNVANIHSTNTQRGANVENTPYRPLDVVQQSRDTGGVVSSYRADGSTPTQHYDPSHPSANADGLVATPNVSLDKEVANQKLSTYTYNANLKVMQTADNMMESLLNIQS